MTFTLCQLQTSGSPCEADLDVAVDNNVSVRLIDDDQDVDPRSLEVDNHVVSKVCTYFYVLSTLLLVSVFRVDVFICEPSLAKLYSLI